MKLLVAILAPALLALVACGSAYSILAGLRVRAFLPKPLGGGGRAPSVSLLRPLHGWEPGLERALGSVLGQDYAGNVQFIFGVQDAADGALPVVKRLKHGHAELDLSLVVDSRSHGANHKISNLINMAATARNEIVVLADSDISVSPDYLSRIIAALAQPGVGVVTCPYFGEARSGVWSRLAAMGINYNFLPNVAVGVSLGIAQPCMGSTIAMRREVLDKIGGFGAFADDLADDYAIGRAVRAAGYRSVVAAAPVAHGCAEESLPELIGHELRWACTIRAVDPWGYAGTVMTHALALALVSVAVLRGSPTSIAMVALAGASRLWLMRQVDRFAGLKREVWWMLPVRDMISFGVFLSSLFVRDVEWRGTRFRVDRHGALSQI